MSGRVRSWLLDGFSWFAVAIASVWLAVLLDAADVDWPFRTLALVFVLGWSFLAWLAWREAELS